MSPASRVTLDAIATLQRLSDLLQVRRGQLAADAGLTVRQWQVLERISTEHFMPSLFARSLDCTPANVSKTLRQLQDKGLISAHVAKADGRQREYILTRMGRRAIAGLRRARARAIAAVWGAFEPSELKRFTEFGATLADRLDAYSTAGK